MSDFEVKSEEDTLNAKALLLILGGVILATLACVGVAWFALDLREEDYRPGRVFPEREIRGKDVVSGVEQTLIDLRDHGGELGAEKRSRLGSWGWVDKERRLVRIPIETAIDVTAGEAK
jgi:hypothetical protein